MIEKMDGELEIYIKAILKEKVDNALELLNKAIDIGEKDYETKEKLDEYAKRRQMEKKFYEYGKE